MKKHIPNALSVLRMIVALGLPFLVDQVGLFAFLYGFAGFTDLLDGYLARKWKSQSLWGARLDSAADLILFSVIAYLVFRLYSDRLTWQQLVLLMTVIAVRGINMGLTYRKYRQVVFVHTWANKAAGLAVYALPILLLLVRSKYVLTIVAIVALTAALEELAISLFYLHADVNRRWIGDK